MKWNNNISTCEGNTNMDRVDNKENGKMIDKANVKGKLILAEKIYIWRRMEWKEDKQDDSEKETCSNVAIYEGEYKEGKNKEKYF